MSSSAEWSRDPYLTATTSGEGSPGAAQCKAGRVGITGTWVQISVSPLHKATSPHSSFLFADGDSEAHIPDVVGNEAKYALGGG